MAKFIRIDRLWYGEPMKTEPTVAGLENLLKSFTEIKNVHDGTLQFSSEAPETTKYKNALNGRTYFVEKTSNGSNTIEFAMGEYSLEDVVAFVGGTLIKETEKVVGWKSNDDLKVINKALIAHFQTGGYVIYTNAAIVADSNNPQDNALTLKVTAEATQNDNEGVSAEYRFKTE